MGDAVFVCLLALPLTISKNAVRQLKGYPLSPDRHYFDDASTNDTLVYFSAHFF